MNKPDILSILGICATLAGSAGLIHQYLIQNHKPTTYQSYLGHGLYLRQKSNIVNLVNAQNKVISSYDDIIATPSGFRARQGICDYVLDKTGMILENTCR